MKSITIRDIAKATGFSIMTVSLSLNPRASSVRVSDETRNTIVSCAKRLGYKPNIVARGLGGGRTNIVGVMFCGSTDEFYSELLSCIDIELHRFGLSGFYTYWRNAHEFDLSLEAMRQYKVCGILTGHNLPALYNSGVPVLCYGSKHELFESVYPNIHRIAQCAVDYASQRGYSRIGYIGKEQLLRSKEFVNVMNAHGLSPDYYFLSKRQDGYGFTAARELLKRDTLPEVIICDRDHTAFEVMSELQSRGLQIPKDVSFIGVNNVSFCEITTPRLTSVDLRISDLAKKLVSRLLHLIEHPNEKRRDEIFDVDIAERDSCPEKSNHMEG